MWGGGGGGDSPGRVVGAGSGISKVAVTGKN